MTFWVMFNFNNKKKLYSFVVDRDYGSGLRTECHFIPAWQQMREHGVFHHVQGSRRIILSMILLKSLTNSDWTTWLSWVISGPFTSINKLQNAGLVPVPVDYKSSSSSSIEFKKFWRHSWALEESPPNWRNELQKNINDILLLFLWRANFVEDFCIFFV